MSDASYHRRKAAQAKRLAGGLSKKEDRDSLLALAEQERLKAEIAEALERKPAQSDD
jgi:hypothetical protein